MRRTLLAFMAFAVSHNPAGAETELAAGAYEIEVSLELPFVLDTSTRKTERLCLGKNQSVTLGLAVLSANNPLGKCPTSAVQSSTDALTFDVVCQGLNAAVGHARYDIMDDHFRGRIEMKMGGKNMTMTEVQVGRRIGACEMLKTQ